MVQTSGAPALIAYSRPFRFVYKDSNENWSPTLDQINNSNYDYVKLHRLSTSFDIGLPLPLCLHIGFDGALILPAIEEFLPIEKAVEKFNRFLGELLLGGIYSEPVDPINVGKGVVYTTGYFRSFGMSSGLDTQLHTALQTKSASPIHAIMLLEPEHITAYELHEARNKGMKISTSVSNLSPQLILHGVSALVVHSWSDALSYFWIVVEQLVSYLWQEKIIVSGRAPSIPINGRNEFLKDTRTWTTSARIEMLFQKSLIDDRTYQLLNEARKARNTLVHFGKAPTQSETEAAFNSVFRLIGLICDNSPESLISLVEGFKARDPITRRYNQHREISPDQVKYWMGPLPPIPGENEWGGKEYEKVFPPSDNS